MFSQLKNIPSAILHVLLGICNRNKVEHIKQLLHPLKYIFLYFSNITLKIQHEDWSNYFPPMGEEEEKGRIVNNFLSSGLESLQSVFLCIPQRCTEVPSGYINLHYLDLVI